MREEILVGGEVEEEESQYLSRLNRQPIKFEWKSRWLKGNEYSFMLENVEKYCQQFNLQKYRNKTHPTEIYEQPQNGMLYFVEGGGLGSEFGFPRVEGKKKYRWKKMNFTTDLPKKNPQVTYIVASTTHTHSPPIDETQEKLFRMHAVVPYQRENLQPSQSYILCHILEIKRRRENDGLNHCVNKESNQIDMYRLFALLHNTVHNIK